ncbi:hypothetical protein D9757_000760 [Collybiopsis confluens]|uniref:snRNA-activating protein complex subunit 3 n=1 Tax=Collybiopsis confluens TaxID=2823264 RepID=A0A8H5I164_9AGAR|nr:hypothetical protein D9757_000760 [Collybiopsis confluens]
MNARLEYMLSSEFGPPSEPIDLKKFRQDADALTHTVPDVLDSEGHRLAVAEECSVHDIHASITDIWNNPKLSAYLYTSHDKAIAALHGTKSSKLAKTRKKTLTISASHDELQEIREIQAKLDAVSLSSWKLMPDAAIFTRPPRNSDYNTLTATKTAESSVDFRLDADSADVLITITAHSKVQWRTSIFNKTSQHVLEASQSLGDLFEAIPCVSNELPEEILASDHVIGYKETCGMGGSSGCVILVDDLVYGDGLNEEDYADKVMQHLKITKSTSNIKKAKTTLHDTPLSSLVLQLNVPYWLLHQGNCEHFIVIDEIRNVLDPFSSFQRTKFRY